jgi:CRISPR/Cas system CSM-associated protein Csm3 (group 7 of RAMP superfamily)
MRTLILEGTCTALTSISHNGGEKNGTIVQLRREKFVQPKGNVVEIPIVSGNSIRGKLRDLAAIDILTKKDGAKVEVDADTFNLLFSGGSLESTGGKNLDIEKVRQMRRDIPTISIFGCSVGNVIVPGKVDIGKLIPICKETLHLIPEKFHGDAEIKTIWEYCQIEMNTRKDDTKDENKREFIKQEYLTEDLRGGQMMYYMETLVAGTRFYWKVCLRDTTDIETGAFLSILQSWAAQSSQAGGNGRVGHGRLKVELTETTVVDSEMEFENSDFVTYIDKANQAKKDVTDYFEKGVSKTLFE